MRGEARTTIAAPADRLWAMVTDISRMPEWSPETYRTKWLGDATGPVVGARFLGWNRHGLLRWWTRPKVTEVVPGSVFEFDTGTTRWRYEFHPMGPDTTEVVESYETRPLPGYDPVLRVFNRGDQLTKGAERTLAAIKAAAESESTPS